MLSSMKSTFGQDTHFGSSKLSLSLRKTPLRKELSMLPEDINALHAILVNASQNKNQSEYDTVLAWNKIRRHKAYWTQFGCQSESDYLTTYNLIDGFRLGCLAVIVELFDRNTYLLLGEGVLGFMIRHISMVQEDSDKKKDDYHRIFNIYKAKHETFNKGKFYDIVKAYVATQYKGKMEKRLAESASTRRGFARQLVASGKQSVSPNVSADIQYKPVLCHGCEDKVAIIDACYDYIDTLTKILMDNTIPVPERPKLVR